MTVNLHLACGKKFIPGFIHVDLSDYAHVAYRCDIRQLPMFRDASVDLIYCSHALQYFDRFEVYVALREWHRILKPGGTLRVAVPDFDAIIAVYKKYGKLEHRGILGPLYGRMQVKKGDMIYHKTVYNFESLTNVLEFAGFKKVRRYDWRKTIHKDYDDFSQAYVPHMDKENGVLISLNVEATK